MRYSFQNPKFIKTVVSCDDLLPSLPTIALVGRSNVGKSSLLNHLFKSKNLAKTSSTPGKTRAVQLFSLGDELLFADLPGYGYAKVSHKEKESWGSLADGYLNMRADVILFLLDIRRIPSSDDEQMLEWIASKKISVIFVFTKVDKLKKSELIRQTNANLSLLVNPGINRWSYVHYSSIKNIGRNQLMIKICEALP